MEKKLGNLRKKYILKELFYETLLRVHADYLADWGLPGQFKAPEVADGVLDDVGQGRAINFAKKSKKPT